MCLFYFSCVHRDSCTKNDLTLKSSDYEALILEEKSNSKCPDKEMVCCHKDDKETPLMDMSTSEPDPKDDDDSDCSEYVDIGFR